MTFDAKETEIFVWESMVGHGWKVTEARRNSVGQPVDWTILADGLTWEGAVSYAKRLRKSLSMK